MALLVKKDDCGKDIGKKPMMPLKTLDVICRRRYVKNTQFYFTNRKKNDFKVDLSSPLKRPKSDKLLSYIKYNDLKKRALIRRNESVPVHMKLGSKYDNIMGLTNRLHVPCPPDDVKTVVDLHPEFYTVIEGRPLRAYDDVKVYINNIRNYAMLQQQIGYKKDLHLKIARDISDESKILCECEGNVKNQILNFQRFLLEDHKKVMTETVKLEQLNAKLQAVNNIFLGYITKITILNNILFKLDYRRNTLKLYRSFCLFVAPMTWRRKFDERVQGRYLSITQFETDSFTVDDDLVDYMDIDRTIYHAKIDLSRPFPPVLYFKKPEQMLEVFGNMQYHGGNYMTLISQTSDSFAFIKSDKTCSAAINQEIDYFQFSIDTLLNTIEMEELNEIYLQEKFYRILNGQFCSAVGSEDSLKLQICIEFVYEQIIGGRDQIHINLRDPMMTLERLYDTYHSRLDALDFKTVKIAQTELYKQDIKYMVRAHHAHRELKAFHIMRDSLNKAFSPPLKFKKVRREKFKRKLNFNKSQKEATKIVLTEDDRIGILAFTDWSEGMDPEPFLTKYKNEIEPLLMEAQHALVAKKSSSFGNF